MKQAKEKELSPALRALADPTRLKILLMLEGKPRTVNEIVEFFDLSQPTISRHLQTLAAADLVIREQHGREVTYRLNPERIGNVCVSLAACFPCCCVSVVSTTQPGCDPSVRVVEIESTDNQGDSPGQATAREANADDQKNTEKKNSRSGHKPKNKATNSKGDTQ